MVRESLAEKGDILSNAPQRDEGSSHTDIWSDSLLGIASCAS